jgi:hypothetical protein
MYAADQSSNAMDRATEAQKSIQQQQLDMAREQYNHYKSTYEPLEDTFANQAKDYNSEANRTKAAEEAGGDVTSSYANLRQQLSSTPGLDPSSTTYANLMTKLGVQQAGQTAAAETGARRAVDAQGAARMQDAISMGKGLSSNATSALNGASMAAGSLGQLGLAQGQVAGQQAAGIGRAIGGLSQDPAVQAQFKSWFTSPNSLSDGYSTVPMEPVGSAPAFNNSADMSQFINETPVVTGV